jgi:hypothetical protein
MPAAKVLLRFAHKTVQAARISGLYRRQGIARRGPEGHARTHPTLKIFY